MRRINRVLFWANVVFAAMNIGLLVSGCAKDPGFTAVIAVLNIVAAWVMRNDR
jgi:hypothetical protein